MSHTHDNALDIVRRAMAHSSVEKVDGICGTVMVKMPIENYSELKQMAERLERREEDQP